MGSGAAALKRLSSTNSLSGDERSAAPKEHFQSHSRHSLDWYFKETEDPKLKKSSSQDSLSWYNADSTRPHSSEGARERAVTEESKCFPRSELEEADEPDDEPVDLPVTLPSKPLRASVAFAEEPAEEEEEEDEDEDEEETHREVDRTMKQGFADVTMKMPPSQIRKSLPNFYEDNSEASEEYIAPRNSMTVPRNGRRRSLTEGPDHIAFATKPVNYFSDLVQSQLYYRDRKNDLAKGLSNDPFKFLSNDWLEGLDDRAEEEHSHKVDPDDREAETEEEKHDREAREVVQRKEQIENVAEIQRMDELVNDVGDGWKLWLRGRDFRSEFKLQPQLTKAEEKQLEWEEKEKAAPKPPRVVDGKSWIRVPADVRKPKGKLHCWRADFVKVARDDADLLGLERPTMAAESIRELARKDWEIIDQFYWHVEAVDLDGNRELWSPSFVSYIWEYWRRSDLGGHVHLSANELEAKANSEALKGLGPDGLSQGLFPRKPVQWPRPVYKPPCLKVPSKVFHVIEQPDLPALPRRFPYHNFYKDGELEKTMAQNLQGSEAYDAMLGTSDRLQAAAKSALRSEKVEQHKRYVESIL